MNEWLNELPCVSEGVQFYSATMNILAVDGPVRVETCRV
jgi:hypothetical protein